MKRKVARICPGLLLIAAAAFVSAQVPEQAYWAQWRGPFFNGMARGDAPTVWSDTSNIKWTAEIPGRGHSTPVIWEIRYFSPLQFRPASRPPRSKPATAHRAVSSHASPAHHAAGAAGR